MENPLSSDTESTTDSHNWSSDVEEQIQFIEENCKNNAIIAKEKYLQFIEQIKFFKIPIIFLSGINSVFSVGLTSYLSQESVSVIVCMISFLVSMISSIEMYLNLTKKIDIANQTYRDYYILSVKINNVLRIKREHRNELDGRAFLTECLNNYEKIFQASNIYNEYINDKLTNYDKNEKNIIF